MQVVGAEQLKRVVESQHGGIATFLQAVRVSGGKGDAKADPSEWDGVVHIFELKDHPKAKRAYAWSSPVKGSTRTRLFAVLHMGRVTGPVEAVKAAAGAIRKYGAQGARGVSAGTFSVR